jgi:hypothetical protein
MDLLSRLVRAVCFVRVSVQPRSPGATIAPIVIAATVGALITLGARRGGALEPFIAGGQLLIPGAARWAAGAVGALLHGAWMSAWSALYGTVLSVRHGWRPIADAAGIAAVAFGISLLLPDALLGPVATLTFAEQLFLHVLLALSLATGMRLAPVG